MKVFNIILFLIIISVSPSHSKEIINMDEYISKKLYEKDSSYISAKQSDINIKILPKWTYVNIFYSVRSIIFRDNMTINFNNFNACFLLLKETSLEIKDQNLSKSNIYCVNNHNGKTFNLFKSLNNYNNIIK